MPIAPISRDNYNRKYIKPKMFNKNFYVNDVFRIEFENGKWYMYARNLHMGIEKLDITHATIEDNEPMWRLLGCSCHVHLKFWRSKKVKKITARSGMEWVLM